MADDNPDESLKRFVYAKLTDGLYDRMIKYCKEMGVMRSSLMRAALTTYLNNHEKSSK